MEDAGDFSWSNLSYGLMLFYHFTILQITGLVSYEDIIQPLFPYLLILCMSSALFAVDISQSQQHALPCCFGPLLWTTLSRRCHFPSVRNGAARKQRLPYSGFLLSYASLFH